MNNHEKLLTVIGEELQRLRDAVQNTALGRDIDQAFGQTLTLLGKNVAQQRGAITDDDVFRTLVRARIGANISQATIPEITRVIIMALQCEPTAVYIAEAFHDHAHMWEDSIGRDESFVIGTEELSLGDEEDCGCRLIRFMFGGEGFGEPASVRVRVDWEAVNPPISVEQFLWFVWRIVAAGVKPVVYTERTFEVGDLPLEQDDNTGLGSTLDPNIGGRLSGWYELTEEPTL